MRLPFLPKLVGFCLFVAFAVAGEETANSDLVDAARAGDVVKLQTALDRGATINYQNPFGETALMNAADAGQMETLKLLIAKGAAASRPSALLSRLSERGSKNDYDYE